MIHKISVNMPAKPADYPILIGANLENVTAWLPKQRFNRIVIITDHGVKKRYGFALQKCLKQKGHHVLLLSFPAGEKSKNEKTKQIIEHTMQRHHCGRDTLVLALGGGVVGDLAGFIAATYLRGVPYIQIPTTLLAMVDSSVGGKTGINTVHGKNLIGAICQPLCVVVDVVLLTSLSRKNMINGLIEAIKMFLTHDSESFNFTASHLLHIIKGDAKLVKEIVARATTIKAAVVSLDERERGERSVLNFGHTIGHALENISNYTLAHGYAVGYGIVVEATISHLLGLLDSNQLLTIINLFARLGIQGKDLQKYDLTKLIQATKIDKKARFGSVHYTLLQKIGRAHRTNGKYVHPVPDKIVRLAFKNAMSR